MLSKSLEIRIITIPKTITTPTRVVIYANSFLSALSKMILSIPNKIPILAILKIKLISIGLLSLQ